MEEPLEFTREAWQGRIRACRGIGASLSPEDVERFDADHRKLLEATAPDAFSVLHQMTIHVYVRKNGRPSGIFSEIRKPSPSPSGTGGNSRPTT
jgi:hypothetical protein